MSDEPAGRGEQTGTGGGIADEMGMTELMGGVDPGTVDLGDDVSRTPGNQDSVLQGNRGTVEGGGDPGTTDLGPDVHRGA